MFECSLAQLYAIQFLNLIQRFVHFKVSPHKDVNLFGSFLFKMFKIREKFLSQFPLQLKLIHALTSPDQSAIILFFF